MVQSTRIRDCEFRPSIQNWIFCMIWFVSVVESIVQTIHGKYLEFFKLDSSLGAMHWYIIVCSIALTLTGMYIYNYIVIKQYAGSESIYFRDKFLWSTKFYDHN